MSIGHPDLSADEFSEAAQATLDLIHSFKLHNYSTKATLHALAAFVSKTMIEGGMVTESDFDAFEQTLDWYLANRIRCEAAVTP